VVALYDAGITAAGLPFLAMEHVPGGSWGDRVRRDGACSANQVVKVGIEVADALTAAHEAGIVHRDIKPNPPPLADSACMVLVPAGSDDQAAYL